MIKLISIVGARPQFIKAGAVRRALDSWNLKAPSRRRMEEVLVHTGQHYDHNMSTVFFEELQLPKPAYNLGVGSETHGRQTALMMEGIERVLLKEKPDLVLVYGDTNSTLAGVLAAAKLQIPSAHVEAGLRSYNRRMPEEINRVVADELSQILFCPTATAVENLCREGIVDDGRESEKGSRDAFQVRRVVRVGDVMADSIFFHQKLAAEKSRIIKRLGLLKKPAEGRYVLLTLHRAENVDDPLRLRNILEAIRKIAASGYRVVFPVHPRTQKRLYELGYPKLTGQEAPWPNIQIIEPVAYLDMLALEKHAYVIVTDSGGVQKEAFLLRVPCITVREETEWVETVDWGWNRLTGSDPHKILEAFECLLARTGSHAPFPVRTFTGENDPHPYGTGRAAEEIVAFLADFLCPEGEHP